jgi:multiple sugar transport system substrate-binding protein
MPAKVTLKGMTWSDPRGYDPMIAASAAFSEQHPEVSISWDKRSLQGFESTPVEELAAEYDLMIIDHPHVGAVVDSGCLLPLDDWLPQETLTALENETVGKSFVSYLLSGHQWAFPVDAAAQVQAHRADLGDRAVDWAGIVAAARQGKVVLPLRPPHSLMCFYTLAANIGHPCGSDRDQLLPDAVAMTVLTALNEVTDNIDPACFEMDPIAALDLLSESDKISTAPLIYLYKGYSDQGYRSNRISYSDIPVMGGSGPIGSALGGTGIAVSSRTNYPQTCADFAGFVAGAQCQSGLYTRSNGQPGNAIAWASADVNEPVLNAYSNTRLTHEAAWLRPRHKGYMAFQQTGSEIINAALTEKMDLPSAISALNREFAASFDNESV